MCIYIERECERDREKEREREHNYARPTCVYESHTEKSANGKWPKPCMDSHKPLVYSKFQRCGRCAQICILVYNIHRDNKHTSNPIISGNHNNNNNNRYHNHHCPHYCVAHQRLILNAVATPVF